MAWLDEVGAYLQSQGVGVLAATLFLGIEPPAPDQCWTILESPATLGPVRVMGVGGASVRLDRPRGQLRARAADYPTARSMAEQALAVLDWLGPATLSGTRYLHVEALQRPPFLLDRDANDRFILGFNFEVTKRP